MNFPKLHIVRPHRLPSQQLMDQKNIFFPQKRFSKEEFQVTKLQLQKQLKEDLYLLMKYLLTKQVAVSFMLYSIFFLLHQYSK